MAKVIAAMAAVLIVYEGIFDGRPVAVKRMQIENFEIAEKEAKKMGAWVSLLAGGCFVLGGLASIYIMFFMKPKTDIQILVWIGHTFRRH